ncbi:MAG: glycosyltransferase family 2 protein [Candidatus Margulisbacteria bacterium]|nr:glycosyltransferase family 2 protein [Candidatus Margulisiibacteriota bacterium]
MSVILSICIPTYKMAQYLDYALKSIAEQVTKEQLKQLEICISDNASPDNTTEIVKKWQKDSVVSIKYFCHQENKGMDENLLQVVKMAAGKYCWFLGSDDALMPDAIARIIREIGSADDPDIIFCNRIECDMGMNPKVNKPWLKQPKKDCLFNLAYDKSFIGYSKSVSSLGGLFSYLSSLVFKRSRWLDVKGYESYIGHHYLHIFMLFKFLEKGCKVKYVYDPLVYCRINDVYEKLFGHTKRLIHDLNAYSLLAEMTIKEKPDVLRAFNKLMYREHSYRNVWSYSACEPERKQWEEVIPYLRKFNYPEWVIYISTIRWLSKILYRV